MAIESDLSWGSRQGRSQGLVKECLGGGDPALRRHFDQISKGEPVGDVPADAELDDIGVEMTVTVDRVTDDRFSH